MNIVSAAQPTRRLFPALAIIAAWALLAIAWTPATTLVEHGPGAWPFDGGVFLFMLIGFIPWMAATPLIVSLARRFPVVPSHPASLAVHALAGLILIPILAVAGRLLAARLTGMGSTDALAAVITSLYSIPTYVAVAAIGQGIAYLERERSAPPPPHHPRRLAIRERGRTELLDTRQIDYVDVAGHYLCVHVGDVVHVTRGQLKDLEASLDPREFARIHRSTLVRLDRVKSLTERRNGDCDLILADGRKLLLSRTYRDLLQARLGL